MCEQCSTLSPKKRGSSLDVTAHRGDRNRYRDWKDSLCRGPAGGLMVPLNRGTLYIDIFERWSLPVVLCASTELGTANHSLLSIEALRKRHISVRGIAFIGERNPESEGAICEIGRVRALGGCLGLRLLRPIRCRKYSKAHLCVAIS